MGRHGPNGCLLDPLQTRSKIEAEDVQASGRRGKRSEAPYRIRNLQGNGILRPACRSTRRESILGVGSLTALTRIQNVIARVPRGRVITYGQAAAAAGFPGAPRLTVRALHAGEGLPWHRVVGAGGRISLPGEEGREQRLRLEMEGVTFRSGRVRMDLHGWSPRSDVRHRKR